LPLHRSKIGPESADPPPERQAATLKVDQNLDLPRLEGRSLGSAANHFSDQAPEPGIHQLPVDQVFRRHTALIGGFWKIFYFGSPLSSCG